MTYADRARLGLARCATKAAQAQTKADACRTAQGRLEWSELAADYRHNADEWRKLLDELDELTELGCTECGAAEGESCDPDSGCGCDRCVNQRAHDEDADRFDAYA